MSTATPDQPNQNESSRLERELAEILDRARADDLTPPPPPRPTPSLRSIPGGLSAPSTNPLARLPEAALWMFGSLFLAIFAVMIDGFSPFLANLLAFAAVVAILMPIFLYHRKPSVPPPSQMWRGQMLDVTPTQQTPLDQLRQWWNNRAGR